MLTRIMTDVLIAVGVIIAYLPFAVATVKVGYIWGWW